MFLNLVRGEPGRLPPPVENMEGQWSTGERAAVAERMRYAVVGSPSTVQKRLQEIAAETRADEFIASGQIFDHAARVRSFEIGAAAFALLT